MTTPKYPCFFIFQTSGASIIDELSEVLLSMEHTAPLEELVSVAQPLLEVISVIYEVRDVA